MKKFKLTIDDYLTAQKLHAGSAQALRQALVLVVLSGVGLFFSGVLPGGRQFDPLMLAVWVPLVVGVAVMVPRSLRKQHQSNYALQKSLQDDVKMEFDSEALRGASESGALVLRWKDLVKYKANDSVIILYESPALIRIVPTSAFESAEELDEFLSHCRSGSLRQ